MASTYVTINAYQNRHLFGAIVDGGMRLSEIGRIVQEEWLRTPLLRPGVELDDFQVMPNHFHGVISFILNEEESSAPAPPTHEGTGRTLCAPTTRGSAPFTRSRRSLGSTIGGFKAKTTSMIRQLTNDPALRVWQRGFFETVIRDDGHLERVCDYIRENPSRLQARQEIRDLGEGLVPG